MRLRDVPETFVNRLLATHSEGGAGEESRPVASNWTGVWNPVFCDVRCIARQFPSGSPRHFAACHSSLVMGSLVERLSLSVT